MSVTPPRPGVSADGPVLSISCLAETVRIGTRGWHYSKTSQSLHTHTFYIQWKVSAISLSNKLVDRLTPEGQGHYLMTLAVALAWRWRGVAPGKSNEFRGNSTEFLVPNVAVSYDVIAHSPWDLRRLLYGTQTGFHLVTVGTTRLVSFTASGQLGRSRLMTSRDRVLATTILSRSCLAALLTQTWEVFHRAGALNVLYRGWTFYKQACTRDILNT